MCPADGKGLNMNIYYSEVLWTETLPIYWNNSKYSTVACIEYDESPSNIVLLYAYLTRTFKKVHRTTGWEDEEEMQNRRLRYTFDTLSGWNCLCAENLGPTVSTFIKAISVNSIFLYQPLCLSFTQPLPLNTGPQGQHFMCLRRGH